MVDVGGIRLLLLLTGIGVDIVLEWSTVGRFVRDLGKVAVVAEFADTAVFDVEVVIVVVGLGS